jgi:uncharacterized protein YndB with AHSA1/START domain
MMPSTTDAIRKSVVLNAPLERVWHAISDARQFGAWFGAALDGPFVAGRRVAGRITPTTVDPEVAKLQEPHAGTPFEVLVTRVEPMRHLSFRWHPYQAKAGEEQPPMTLVEFELEPVDEGVRLTITESGFDAVPLARRAEAFEGNEGGWEHQTRLIAKYLARPAER